MGSCQKKKEKQWLSGDKYFVLRKRGGGRMALPEVSKGKILEAMARFDRELRISPQWQG